MADQISDNLLDQFLARDPKSHVAVETLVTTGQVVVAGEVSSNAYVDVADTTRRLINNIGYNRGAYRFDGDSCGILSALHEQSGDINRGVSRESDADKSEEELQGAGDQGMMFGYAVAETPEYMPLTLSLSHLILRELADIRREGKDMAYYRKGKHVTYLRPDSKSQVTVEYCPDKRPRRIHTIVVSTQHDDFIPALDNSPEAQAQADNEMLAVIERDVREILLPRVKAKLPEEIRSLWGEDVNVIVNPTGKFVIGGPHGDTGLTGRKIIVDTYGGRGAHGGGAFSGKDPSKVDRSAAYACRHIAKNMVAAGVAREMLVQVAYAIGRPDPVSIFVDTFGTAAPGLTDADIAAGVSELFDLRPFAIEKRLKLREPIYLETAAYGHVGREPKWVEKVYQDRYEKTPLVKKVELFTWEKLDSVETIRKYFNLEKPLS